MTQQYFFGYGSLVNLRTHDYGGAHPVSLQGWRRVWLSSSRRDRSFLSVQPDTGFQIQGMLAKVPHGNWAALDAREFAYNRQELSRSDLSGAHDRHQAIQIYQGNPAFVAPDTEKKPILLSYLDVVVQGYLDHFGRNGVAEFFATTLGWDTPIRNDRSTPAYPRAQTLTQDEHALVDKHLAELSAVIKEPESPVMGAKHRSG